MRNTDFNSDLKCIKICIKGKYMNAVEEFEIYTAFKQQTLNEQLKFDSNTLYNTEIRIQEAAVKHSWSPYQ